MKIVPSAKDRCDWHHVQYSDALYWGVYNRASSGFLVASLPILPVVFSGFMCGQGWAFANALCFVPRSLKPSRRRDLCTAPLVWWLSSPWDSDVCMYGCTITCLVEDFEKGLFKFARPSLWNVRVFERRVAFRPMVDDYGYDVTGIRTGVVIGRGSIDQQALTSILSHIMFVTKLFGKHRPFTF